MFAHTVCSLVVWTLIFSAVCCVQYSSVLWQQWQWRTESCCCRLQGDAHCALSESCTAQRIVVSPPQREPEFVTSKRYWLQHTGLLFSCQNRPFLTLGELLHQHHHVGFPIHSPQKAQSCNASILLHTQCLAELIDIQRYSTPPSGHQINCCNFTRGCWWHWGMHNAGTALQCKTSFFCRKKSPLQQWSPSSRSLPQ